MMKKLTMLLMLLVSLATANAKCDWSKVSLGKSNTCNAYKFEVTGTVDTCYKHSILLVKKGSTTPLYTGNNRVFGYTFNDTGYYFVKVSIKNACCGGDTLFYDYIHVTCKPTAPKCNWSSIKLQQLNERNFYQWDLTGSALDDTCVNFMFTLIDVQTKKLDTLYQESGTCQHQFNKKGKYYLRVVLRNRCKGCDTLIYRPIEIIYFPKCNFTYRMKSTNGKCLDSMVGEMGMGPVLKGDTCWQWYSYIWNGPMLDSLSNLDWDSTLMTDEQLTMYYDFNDSDMVWFKGPENGARLIKYKFPHNGHYLVATQWYNKCLNQDTFFFTRITIKCDKTNGVTLISKNSIVVSPNPANDRVLVCLTTPIKNPLCIYVLYDVSGKVVMSGSISSCSQLNVSSLKDGIYTFKTGNLTQKIVISR